MSAPINLTGFADDFARAAAECLAVRPGPPIPDCCGICVRASDVGVAVEGDPVAYAYPGCPAHDPDTAPQDSAPQDDGR